jgi:Tfp pilus assembly protein PilF
LGTDTAVLKSKKGDAIRYYGGGFEVSLTLISKAMGFDIPGRNYFYLRHLLLALLGWLAMLAAGGTARLLGNWRMAVLTIILVGFAPRFFGHSMMNPKDIPFAAGYMCSIYFMFRVFSQFQQPRRSDLIGLALALGYSLSIRVGAVLLFIYFIAFFLSYTFILKLAKKSVPSLKQLLLVAGIPLLGGFAFGVLFWPYGLMSPISHTIESLTTFSNFPVSVNVLFKGNMVWSNDIPFEYLFVWIAYTVPIAFLAGLVFLLVFLWNNIKTRPLFLLLSHLFVVLFPLFYVVYKDSPLYDGWRHFNFIYVAAAPIAAMGWDSLIKWLKNKGKYAQWIPVGLFVLLTIGPVWHIVRNISIPYVYFNPIAGGTEGAFGEFEMDYWGISTRQAVEKMEEAGIFYPGMEKLTIGVNFSYGVRHWLHPDYADSVKVTYVRYRERYESSDWDYSIFVGRFMDGAHMKAIDWPGSVRVIETVEVDGVPVCGIYEKGASYVYEGINAARRRNWDQAISLLQKELAYDPVNELASFYLAEAYAGKGQSNQALNQYEKTLELNPHSQQVIMKTALAYMNQGKWMEAEGHLKSHSERNPRDYASLYYLALIHARTNRLSSAAEYIEQSIQVNPNFKEAYQLGAQIYQALGNTSKASYYNSLAN